MLRQRSVNLFVSVKSSCAHNPGLPEGSNTVSVIRGKHWSCTFRNLCANFQGSFFHDSLKQNLDNSHSPSPSYVRFSCDELLCCWFYHPDLNFLLDQSIIKLEKCYNIKYTWSSTLTWLFSILKLLLSPTAPIKILTVPHYPYMSAVTVA